MLHKMENMVMNNSAYKQIHLYSIPPSNISTRVDTICIFLHVNVNVKVIVSFYNGVTQVNANFFLNFHTYHAAHSSTSESN